MDDTDRGHSTWLRVAGGACAVLGLGLALYPKPIDIGPIALIMFGFALFVWPALTEKLSKFSFGPDGLSLEIRERLSAVEQTAAGAAASIGALGSIAAQKADTAEKLVPADGAALDTQKGKWGGGPEANGRTLSARIEAVPGGQLGKIHLLVAPGPAGPPIAGQVSFHLHETFKPFDVQTVTAHANGTATLDLVSYGAFTVGVELDGGRTKLELDLVDAPGAFEPWRSR